MDLASTGAIYLNAGRGTFLPPLTYATGPSGMGVAVADFNGDHKPDLAWANFYGNSVSVMLNTASPPPTAPRPPHRLPMRVLALLE
jgi:hypothetical protein